MSENQPEHANLWSSALALLEPELRPFIQLSAHDVSELSERAVCADDPAAWLGEELSRRGKRKKDLQRLYKIQRMAEDAKRIGNPGSWPGTRLPLKSQPWQNEDGKSMRFGHVFHFDHLIVHAADGTTTVYDTIEELVEIWSVD